MDLEDSKWRGNRNHKAFCENCKYWNKKECDIEFKVQFESQYKDKDCPNYQRKWWKFWVKYL